MLALPSFVWWCATLKTKSDSDFVKLKLKLKFRLNLRRGLKLKHRLRHKLELEIRRPAGIGSSPAAICRRKNSVSIQ